MFLLFRGLVFLEETRFLAIEQGLRADDRAEDLPDATVPRLERAWRQAPVVPIGSSILPLVDEHDFDELAVLAEPGIQLRPRWTGALGVTMLCEEVPERRCVAQPEDEVDVMVGPRDLPRQEIDHPTPEEPMWDLGLLQHGGQLVDQAQ